MTIQDFINKYNGQNGIGDTPQNDGQCVGLVEVWLDILGQPHIWGNACDMPANADRGAYDVIPNSAELVPEPGWIVCFPAGWGGSSVGHTALVAPGTDANHLHVFEQNDRIGGGDGRCRLFELGWDGAVFIRPKVLNQPAPINQGDQDVIVDQGLLNQLYDALLFRAPDPSGISSYVGKPLNEVFAALYNSDERHNHVDSTWVLGSEAAANNWQGEIQGLEQQVTDLQAQEVAQSSHPDQEVAQPEAPQPASDPQPTENPAPADQPAPADPLPSSEPTTVPDLPPSTEPSSNAAEATTQAQPSQGQSKQTSVGDSILTDVEGAAMNTFLSRKFLVTVGGIIIAIISALLGAIQTGQALDVTTVLSVVYVAIEGAIDHKNSQN